MFGFNMGSLSGSNFSLCTVHEESEIFDNSAVSFYKENDKEVKGRKISLLRSVQRDHQGVHDNPHTPPVSGQPNVLTDEQHKETCCRVQFKIFGTKNEGNKMFKVILATVSIAILGYNSFFWIHQMLEPIGLKKDQSVSIPCTQLASYFPVARLADYTDNKTDARFKEVNIKRHEAKGETLCEIPLLSVLDKLVNSNENHYPFDDHHGDHGIAPPTGMPEALVQLQSSNTGTSTSMSKVLSIAKFRANNVGTDKTSIIIQREGLYFIYFSIQLAYGTEGHPHCNELKFKTSTMHLIGQSTKNGYLDEKVLLRSKHTCYPMGWQNEGSTKFNGGLFNFVEKDRLFIKVSSPENVQADGNYLGIVKIE